MIDSNKAFRTLLLLDEKVGELVDDRVWCPDLQKGYDPAAAGPAITFAGRGGDSEVETPLIRPRIQVTTWAASAVAAREVYRAIHDLVHGAENIDLGPAGYIMGGLSVVQGQDITDPETGWATVVGFFQLLMRSEPSSSVLRLGGGVQITTVQFITPAAGDFDVAHGLGTVPKGCSIALKSLGLVVFQDPRFDATNIRLTASAAGLVGELEVYV